jgi:uncharacterized membrane protein YgaE (UPF0421/DUF939 family)
MRLGARTVKTGIAVVLAIYITQWLGLSDGVSFSAATAALAIQPSLYRSFKELVDQMKGNIIGILIALISVTLFGNHPFVIGLIVIIAITVNIALKYISDISLLIFVVIAVSVGVKQHYYIAILHRFDLILIGIGCALVVNVLFIPPNHERRLFDDIKTVRTHLSLLMRNMMNRDIQNFSQERSSVQRQIAGASTLFGLYREEHGRVRNKAKYARKILIFQRMTALLEEEMFVIQTIEKQFQKSRHIDFLTEFRQIVVMANAYHEKILGKYEGKIKSPLKHVKYEELFQKLAHLNQQELSFPTLAILVALVEWCDNLDRLDRLVDVYNRRNSNATPAANHP